MRINAVNTVQAQPFKGKLDDDKKTGGAGKAWCSAAIPGLGQFLDGRTGKGLQYLGTGVALFATSQIMNKDFYKGLFTQNQELIQKALINNLKPSKIAVGAVLGIAGIVNYICNIVDAYKGDKK